MNGAKFWVSERMFDEKDLKYCKINEASKGIFPTYFLLDLKLTNEQKEILNRLIKFLTDIKARHTPPPPPKPCPTCGNVPPTFFADTWGLNEVVFLDQKISFYKSLLEPHRVNGDHT